MPPIPVPAPQSIPEPQADAGGRWKAILAIEGTPTADGRMFLPGSITWRELPLTLKAQLVDEEGHTGAVIAGRIDTISRSGMNLIGEGAWDTSPEAQEVKRLVDEQTLRGISVDVAATEVEYEVPAMVDPMPVEEVPVGERVPAPDPDDVPKETVTENVNDYMTRIVKGELGAATICTFPAFAGATIETLVAAGRPVFRFTTQFAQAPVPPAKTPVAPAEAEPDDKPAPAQDADPTKPKAKIPGSGGAMIAVRPAPGEAQQIAKPGGHPPEQLHVTLAHLTDDGDSMTPEQVDAAKEAMAATADVHPALVGTVGGHGNFPTPDGHANVHLADVPHMARMRESLTAGLRERGVEYSANHGFTPHLTTSYSDTPQHGDPAAAGVGLSFTALELHKGGEVIHTEPLRGLPPGAITASAAGLVPVEPPADWFFMPEPDGPTPITVTDEGQVYGHIAEWDTCHLGSPGACVTAPESPSSYAYFNLGEIRCEDGERVAAGSITMRAKHAPLSYSRQQTTEHYDHSGLAAADVRAVDGKWGIWVSGALRPDLAVERVREFRSSKPSGDWRTINGNLELVGCLAVNLPGFPVVRPSVRMADQRRLSLVAAGTLEPHLTERWFAALDAYWTPDLAAARVAELAADL